MKGALRKVNEGIVFTIDEVAPKGKMCYDTIANIVIESLGWQEHYKILASTFGVGLELYMLLEQEMDLILPLEDCLHVEFNTEYPYKIEDGKVIIEL